MYQILEIERIVDFKKEYLLGILNFLSHETEFFIKNTGEETIRDLEVEYHRIDVKIVTNKNVIAVARTDEENNICTLYFGCHFLLYLYKIVTCYYWSHSQSKDDDFIYHHKDKVVQILEDQSPYKDDNWNEYGALLSDDYYLIARENILYIILFVLYHELAHLSYNHVGFLQDRRILEDPHLKASKWLRKFVELDADIGASFFYIRRIFSSPLSILPNGKPLDYPKEQAIYLTLGGIGLLFAIEDLIANKKMSSVDYYKIEEYDRFIYPHPLIRCNIVRMQMHITIDKLNLDSQYVNSLSEIMRSSGRSLLLSMSKAIGFTDERWDMHIDQTLERHSTEAWDWYFDHRDLLLKKLKQIYDG